MVKNPYINAVAAGIYIVGLVLVMSLFVDGPAETEVPLLVPMTMISLFVLSAAVMGYLFVFQPAMLYLDGKKNDAVTFFFKTVGAFAVIAAAFLVTLFVVTTS